jgi:hypothetical protein
MSGTALRETMTRMARPLVERLRGIGWMRRRGVGAGSARRIKVALPLPPLPTGAPPDNDKMEEPG